MKWKGVDIILNWIEIYYILLECCLYYLLIHTLGINIYSSWNKKWNTTYHWSRSWLYLWKLAIPISMFFSVSYILFHSQYFFHHQGINEKWISNIICDSHKESCSLVLCRLFILITCEWCWHQKSFDWNITSQTLHYKRALVTKTAHCNTRQMESEYHQEDLHSCGVAALFTLMCGAPQHQNVTRPDGR